MSIGAFSLALNLIIIFAVIATRWDGADKVLTLWGSFACMLLVMIWARVAEMAEIMREAAERSNEPATSRTMRAK